MIFFSVHHAETEVNSLKTLKLGDYIPPDVMEVSLLSYNTCGTELTGCTIVFHRHGKDIQSLVYVLLY